ncbi:hypothetical protein GQ43DRAFT_205709 [Delitschia confertaspora ATCC 74209]|uniref:Rhodopsin domain-containing protein n=1 Tax=Delitschia confertaspora ATCC 74209 TaxID=1513339 RepID=A0A9P4JRN5_9PLEO|nr:hypothetical protein GQ43DRAFT_205709 [Delitschia confertaspora ATCC 74209]
MAAVSPSSLSSSVSAVSATGILPPGITAPYAAINATDQGGLIAILTAFALGLVLLSISIRIYARHNLSAYRVDDFTFFAASIFYIIQTSLVFRSLAKGQGKLATTLDAEETATVEKLSFTSDLFYLVTIFLSKCSTSFLFLYLTPGRAHHRIIWSGVGAEAIWLVSAVMMEGIRCNGSHPWTNNTANCSNSFARWAYIGIFDCLIEASLIITAMYIVYDLQMSLKSKLVVVGAFSCRIPNIALSILRLIFIHASYLPQTSHHWSTRVISTTQIALGVSITASIVPYLKPFMMAYDQPSTSSYPTRSHGSSNFKLSALTDKSTTTATDGLTENREEDPRYEVQGNHTTITEQQQQHKRKQNLVKNSFRLRPERTKYSAKATASPDLNNGGAEHRHGEGKSEHGSEDSSLMIIKKGVEWSVQFEREGSVGRERRSSAGETAGSWTGGADEIVVIRDRV